jgi:hypothetical protein
VILDLAHLLYRAWNNLTFALSTSTFSIIVFSVVLPWLVFIGVSLYQAKILPKQEHRFRSALRTAFPSAAITAGIELLVWLILFGYMVALTIYRSHNYLLASQQNLGSRVSSKDSEMAQMQATIDALRIQLAQKPAAITKAIEPRDVPLKITVKEYGGWKISAGNDAGTVFFVFATTNKTISPVSVTMTCDRDFRKFDAGVLINRVEIVSVLNLKIQQPDPRTFEYAADSPAWTPESGLGFGIFTESTDGIACKVFQNP